MIRRARSFAEKTFSSPVRGDAFQCTEISQATSEKTMPEITAVIVRWAVLVWKHKYPIAITNVNMLPDEISTKRYALRSVFNPYLHMRRAYGKA